MNEVDSVKIVTLVDNDVWEKGLSSSWGLSFYVEASKNGKPYAILMDTSGSFNVLSENASKLNIDIGAVEAVFLSHWHGDHCGALSYVLPLLKKLTPIYVSSGGSSEIRMIENGGAMANVCSKPVEFKEGVMSTGGLGYGIREHSLLVNVKDKGIVVLTGCSHPGIISIIKRAQQVSGVDKVYAVMGGLHISSASEGARVAEFMREIDVKLASPCHCTGINARNAIAKIMGERYVRNGSGKVIHI